MKEVFGVEGDLGFGVGKMLGYSFVFVGWENGLVISFVC